MNSDGKQSSHVWDRGGEGILGHGGNVLDPQYRGDHTAAYVSENSRNRKPEMAAFHLKNVNHGTKRP